jgi:plasmid stabilization system protein ParE
MKVRYSRRARADLDAIFHYLQEHSPTGARRVREAIYAAVQFIAEYPHASERTDSPSSEASVSIPLPHLL